MSDSRTLVTSRANPLIKELRGLAQKKLREERKQFLVEGIQPVLQALESGANVEMLVVAHALLKSETAKQVVEDQSRGGRRVVEVSEEVFASLAEREHPTGLAAVVKMPLMRLADLKVEEDAVFVALYQVSNPGNLGSILRTADAVKANGVILIGHATDPYAPAAVKASRGAIFTVPCVRLTDAQELTEWSRKHAVRIVTTSDGAVNDLWEADLSTPLALLFGNEGEGLPEELLRQGEAIRIPMAGQVDSLNLAVAAGVILYECVRRGKNE